MFSNDGNVICVFPKSMQFQGYLCKGGGGSTGIQTSFYTNVRLRSFFSNDDFPVKGIHSKGGVLTIIKLYENGNLKECTLAKKAEIDGNKYGKKYKNGL